MKAATLITWLAAAVTLPTAAAQSLLHEEVAAGRAWVPPGQVIAGASIRDAGAVRLGDILRLAPSFMEASPNGIRAEGTLFSAGPLPWRVTVDGREVSRAMPGGSHLETLPVPIAHIDRVVLLPPGPGPAGMSSGGWIQIETLPQDSLSVDVVVRAGSEVGDPGPYRYTELATPNIDRSGPSLDFRAVVPRGAWRVTAGFRADQEHLTDETVLSRVYTLYRGQRKPRMSLIHPALSAAYTREGMRLRVHWDRARLSDLPFFPAIGSELPATRIARRVGVEATYALSSAVSATVVVDLDRNTFAERSNLTDLDLAWGESVRRLDARLTQLRPNGHIRATVRVVDRIPDAEGFASRTPPVSMVEVTRLQQAASGWERIMAAQLMLGAVPSRRILPGAYLQVISPPAPVRLSVRSGFLAETPESQAPDAYWLAGGWDFPGRGTGRSVTGQEAADTRSMTLDASVWSATESQSLGVDLFVRHYDGLNVPEMTLDPDSLFRARYLASVSYADDVSGRVIGGRLWLRQTRSTTMSQTMSYTYTLPAGGATGFRQAMDALPAVQIGYSLRISPVPRVRLLLQARFRSSTVWSAYRVLPGSEEGVRVPSAFTLDATISKDLWGPRITTFVMVRNLGRAEVRTHPVGPVEDLSFAAGLRASL